MIKYSLKQHNWLILKINNTGDETIPMEANNDFFSHGHQTIIDSGDKYWNIPLKISVPLFLTATAASECIYFSFAPLSIEAKIIFSPVIILTSLALLDNVYEQSLKKRLSNNLRNYSTINKITPTGNTYLPVFICNQNNYYNYNQKTKQFQSFIKKLKLSYNDNKNCLSIQTAK